MKGKKTKGNGGANSERGVREGMCGSADGGGVIGRRRASGRFELAARVRFWTRSI